MPGHGLSSPAQSLVPVGCEDNKVDTEAERETGRVAWTGTDKEGQITTYINTQR